MHFHDTPARRRLAIMRASDTKASSKGYSIGGLPHKVEYSRAKPSMPAMPWDETPEPLMTRTAIECWRTAPGRKRGKYD